VTQTNQTASAASTGSTAWTLITGASSGIGEATAAMLAQDGHNVWLIARREDRLNSLALKINAHGGARAEISALDVTNEAAVRAFAETNAARLAQTEVLINNAGLAKGVAPLQDGDLGDWGTMIETNLTGVLRLTRLVLPHMIKRGRGHIVNLGSVAGTVPYPGGNVYCASKSAIHMFNQCLRMDVLGKNIRITEISPGMVETEFSEVRLGDKQKAADVYKGLTPLTAADIAETIRWSLNRPAHVNIQEIVVYPTQQAAPGHVARM
jgi:3-hydroxy acid dehydrogenase / malonic semialdehyde reductase